MRVPESRFAIVTCTLRAFVHGGTRWTGWPKLVRCGRRTPPQRVIGSTLAKNGAEIRPASMEAPEHIARVERRGHAQEDDVESHQGPEHASGRESMDMTLSECLNAAIEMARHGGFAPTQWVLSWVTRMNVSTWVLWKHMPMDQQPSVYSHITEQRLPILHSRVHSDPLTKRKNSSNDLRNLPELQRRKLRRYNMSHGGFFSSEDGRYAKIREMDFFK